MIRHPKAKGARARGLDLGVALPLDLARFMTAVDGGTIADFVALPSLPRLSSLLAAARRGGPALARLIALFAGAVPIGETPAGEIVVYFLAEEPAHGVIAAIEPRRLTPRLLCRGAAELAVICSLLASGVEPELPPFGLAEEESVRTLLERARSLALVVSGTDAQLKAAMRVLAVKPLDEPPPEYPAATARRKKREERTTPLVLGAVVETFFRDGGADVASRLAAHAASSDAVVRDATALLALALGEGKRSAGARELARRRELALRAIRPTKRHAGSPAGDALETTRRIVARFDELPPNAESFAALHEREETLLALAELGDKRVAPELLGRALTGDAAAVDMLAALRDRSIVPHLVGLLGGAPSRVRLYEAAVVRTLVAVRAEEALPALRKLLDDNPLTGWREGLERGGLVRELVHALGELDDAASAPKLLSILESTSQEYRAVLPAAAHALGRLRHVPALAALERLLFSPKEPVTCEAVWAVGAIGQAHASAREGAAALLDRLTGLEPGAEATRFAALAKLRFGKSAPKSAELRRAIDRALWEPAFRQEETSRRRAWGLRALEELAGIAKTEKSARIEGGVLFLGHAAIRHLVTRDDHRVRRAADSAFAAWSLPVPRVRPYFAFALPELERAGGLDALLEAVRDPLGIFRHNVATRLAAIGDERSVRPLAEATARLFAEPPTSTYEYDDAPPHLVAFVRALAKLNRAESNDVLIDGLRSNNHQLRAVIAENAPDDERFVPELMAMLGDPRSFLRSRAERSLTSLGALPPPIEPVTTEISAVVARRIEG
ncbi:MAG: HEAT repeat domain-containing protein [Labilithrix sp.]|nr:HEAT repeat domain-containing protein [Labilithrix sp.]